MQVLNLSSLKKTLFLIVTLLLAVVGSWFFYNRQSKSGGAAEALIPGTSIGVLSLQNPAEFLSQTAQFDWWDEALSIPLISDLYGAIKSLDSLNIHSDLGSLPVHISLHITGNDRLEPLFIVQARGFKWSRASLQIIAQRLFADENVHFSQRNYLGHSLNELQFDSGQLSFLIEGDYLALSANALLVEDVVRAVEQEAGLLAGRHYRLGELNEPASLLLDCGKLGDLASVFSGGETNLLNWEGLYLKMGLKPVAKGLKINGRALFKDSFIAGSESGLHLKNFVPVNASAIRWFGLNPEADTAPEGFDQKAFRSVHAGDLCLLDLDLNNRRPDRVLMATLTNIDKAQRELIGLAERLKQESDTLFKESFMDTEIIFVNQPELPEMLYGSSFRGFEQTYFSTYNDVLLFGSGIDALKEVLSEYDAENTWGKSIERRKYIDDLVQKANITAIYNFEYLPESFWGELKPAWHQFFEEHLPFFNALDVFSLQLSNTSQDLLLSAAVNFNESVSKAAALPTVTSLEAAVNTFADTTLSTRVFVTRNHHTNQRELVFQDAANQFYQVTDQGLIQWKKDLGAQIRGNITQVDYYNNRKLQYLFFTDSAIHLIDRNGDDVKGFPKALATELPPEGHSVIDYDHTRHYRYAAADRRGRVYLYSKEGQPLEGWNPKAMGSPLLALPEHVRIRGRDCFLMVERQGVVHLTNRRGEYYPGFPYQIKKRLAGDVVIDKGTDFSKSHMVVASENGEVLSLDFNARVVSRNQLIRPDAQSQFSLVRDKLDKGFVVARKDVRQVVFFGQDGKQRFSVAVNDPKSANLSFYNFRNDSEVVVVYEKAAAKVNVYNSKGDSLLPGPMAAGQPIGVIYHQSRGEYELFVSFANQVAIYNVVSSQ